MSINREYSKGIHKGIDKTMANLDQSKLPDKAAAVSYAQVNANENHSHLGSLRVNPMTVCMASTVRIDSRVNE